MGVYSGTADQATADVATVMAYRLMSEWMESDDAQKVMAVGRDHPELLNALLASGIATMRDGNWLAGAGGADRALRDPLAAKKVGEALKIIYDNFKPEGPWDAKPHLAKQFGIVNEETGWLPTSTGNEVYYDVFGNVQYRVALSNFGVDAKLAIAASHMDGTGQPNQGETDDPFIYLGYELAAKHPQGPTEAQFEAWFNGVDVQKSPQGNGQNSMRRLALSTICVLTMFAPSSGVGGSWVARGRASRSGDSPRPTSTIRMKTDTSPWTRAGSPELVISRIGIPAVPSRAKGTSAGRASGRQPDTV